MFRRVILGFVICSPLAALCQRQDPRDAVLQSLRSLGVSAEIQREQVSLSSDQAEGVPSIEHARYDMTLHSWLIELRCAQPRHCIPTLAMLNIAAPQLFEGTSVRRQLPILVRAGEHRSLLSDFGTLRFTEPVICLQSGHAGQVIRVRITGTRKLKLAVITESGELRVKDSQ